ncbi:MAG TPA: hypothetical protein VGE74_05950 [Gemmata sp.]
MTSSRIAARYGSYLLGAPAFLGNHLLAAVLLQHAVGFSHDRIELRRLPVEVMAGLAPVFEAVAEPPRCEGERADLFLRGVGVVLGGRADRPGDAAVGLDVDEGGLRVMAGLPF